MITIIGSLNYDLVTYTTRVPNGGETIEGVSFEEHLGGKGLNEAIATSRLSKDKGQVRMWGKVGQDTHGDKMLEELSKSHVCTKLIERLDNVGSGTATILVETELSGENRIVIIPGANGQLKPTSDELEANFADAAAGDFVVLQNEFPGVRTCIEWLASHKPELGVVYNPSPVKRELLDSELLNKVSHLVVNEGEANELVTAFGLEKPEPGNHEELVRALRKSLAHPVIVITLGSKGCIFQQTPRDTIQFVPSVKVDNVVDTTGAGDTFLGGIVSQLYVGEPLKRAIEFATVSSSLVITKKGAVESIPVYEQVIERL